MSSAKLQSSKHTARPRLAVTINTVKHLLHGQHILGTGKPPYPVERTLLTNGILIAGIDSLYQNQQRVPTPHLTIDHQPNPEPTFWRS
jgi:hypothetical protein